MPIIQLAKHFSAISCAPRAQFFANRAFAHAHAMTSFDEIIEQRKTTEHHNSHVGIDSE